MVLGDWHQAPPPAYTPTPGFYGWLPSSVFPNQPNPNQVYMHDSPPPVRNLNFISICNKFQNQHISYLLIKSVFLFSLQYPGISMTI